MEKTFFGAIPYFNDFFIFVFHRVFLFLFVFS